jgi:PmbA protein
MMEQILEQAMKVAQGADVFFVGSEETPVSFQANRLKLLQTRQSQGWAVRLIKDGRVGLASTTNPDHRSQLVEMALETAEFGAPAAFQFPSTHPTNDVKIYDDTVETTPVEELVELSQHLIDQVRAHTPELLCDGGASRSTITVRLINSNGGEVSYRKSVFGLGISGTLVRGTDMLFIGDGESSCQPIREYEQIASETIRQIEMSRRTAAAPEGDLPVIFTPRAVGSALVWPLTIALSGKTVLQGASPLAGQRGKEVLDKRFSLWDDPSIPFQPGSRPADDEGVPTKQLPLIDAGVVANFYYDLQTAGQAGVSSTGNGRRGLGSLPSPAVNALVVDQGDASFQDMVKDIERGLVVEQLMGAGQGNLLQGEISGNVLLGYAVENGEIVGRVKDTVIAGNIYDILRDLVAIGKEGRWMGGGLFTPHIYSARLNIATKK